MKQVFVLLGVVVAGAVGVVTVLTCAAQGNSAPPETRSHLKEGDSQ